MIFCECGKIMEIRDDGLRMAFCLCGRKQVVLGGELTAEDNNPKNEMRNSEVVKEEHKGVGGFPHNCSKCGFGEADVIDLGIAYSDEAAVYLFKCKKCGWSERQSDGTGN